jgi:hypothetical protein
VLLPYECHSGNKAIEMSLAAERDEDRTWRRRPQGIKRERRAINQTWGGGGAPARRAAGRGGVAGACGRRRGPCGHRRRSGK